MCSGRTLVGTCSLARAPCLPSTPLWCLTQKVRLKDRYPFFACDPLVLSHMWMGGVVSEEFMLLLFTGFNLKIPTWLFFDKSRMHWMSEFNEAMKDRNVDIGRLVSAPNGVGKSGLSLAIFVHTFAQGLPVSYIPLAQTWVSASEGSSPKTVFMQTFFAQNADLIVDNPQFHPFFSDQLQDQPVLPGAFANFAKALEASLLPPCGAIVDEQQKLTDAGNMGHEFFKNETGTWTGLFSALRRWDSASAHGLREFRLASGEDHRLVFLNPIADEDALLLLQTRGSPYYVADKLSGDEMKKLIVHLGAVLRPLALVVKGIRNGMAQAELVTRLLNDMEGDCRQKWWDTLSDEERKTAWPRLLNVLRGTEGFAPATKALYDNGLVKRCEKTSRVAPISPLASQALSKVYCSNTKGRFTPLSSITVAREQGNQFESQVLALLADGHIHTFVASSLGDAPQRALTLSGSNLRFFSFIADIESHPTLDVVWVPSMDNFTVDGITVPSQEKLDKGEPLVAFDPSITAPYGSKRVAKYDAWWTSTFKTELQQQFPNQAIHFVVLYTGIFADLDRPITAVPDSDADPHSGQGLGLKATGFFNNHRDALNQVWLVDRIGMQQLGVSL